MRSLRNFSIRRKSKYILFSLFGFVILSILLPFKQENVAINMNILKEKHDRLMQAGFGDMGAPMLLKNIESIKLSGQSIERYGYFSVVSELIPLQRKLRDYRSSNCHKEQHNEYWKLPRVSVILTFYNEHSSVLLRTLHSVINRTPDQLLAEVLVVDDASDEMDVENDELDYYISNYLGPKVRILVMPGHVGNTRSRLLAARDAIGDVLVFLQSSVEVTEGWLPPLLHPILENNKTATAPIVDVIDYYSFAYEPRAPIRGIFNWDLKIQSLPLSETEKHAYPKPYKSPTLTNLIFAIKREWYMHIGGYEELYHLDPIYAEQLELSLKIWLCGGRILKVPCSRIGYVYPSKKYSKNNALHTLEEDVNTFYKRIVEVWIGTAHKNIVYEIYPQLKDVKLKPSNKRRTLQVRRLLHCQPFSWYMDNILPSLKLYDPEQQFDGKATGLFVLMPSEKQLCLDSAFSDTTSIQIYAILMDCKRSEMNMQHWTLHNDNKFHQRNMCLVTQQQMLVNETILLRPCSEIEPNEFKYYEESQRITYRTQLSNTRGRLCLQAEVISMRVFLNECDSGNIYQRWHFQNILGF